MQPDTAGASNVFLADQNCSSSGPGSHLFLSLSTMWPPFVGGHGSVDAGGRDASGGGTRAATVLAWRIDTQKQMAVPPLICVLKCAMASPVIAG